MKKMYFAFLMLGLIITSCGGGDPSGRANDLCACAKDAGIDFDGIKNERDLEKIGRKMEKLSKKKEKEAKKCVLEVMKGVQSDVKDMDDKEITREYYNNLITDYIDGKKIIKGEHPKEVKEAIDSFFSCG